MEIKISFVDIKCKLIGKTTWPLKSDIVCNYCFKGVLNVCIVKKAELC